MPGIPPPQGLCTCYSLFPPISICTHGSALSSDIHMRTWVCDLCGHTGLLGLMLYHYHLEILKTFEQGASYFHFALGLTSYAAWACQYGPLLSYFLWVFTQVSSLPRGLLCLPHLNLQTWPQLSNPYYLLLCYIFLHSTCILLLYCNFHLCILFIICPL